MTERIPVEAVEVAALRESLNRLIDTIVEAAPEQQRHFKTLAVLAVIGGPLLFAVTMAFAIVTAVQNQARDDTIRQGISCLLADLDDHRHTNQFAHEKIAEHVTTPVEIEQPDVIPLTKEQSERLKAYCDPYVKATLSYYFQQTGHQATGP